MTPLQAAHGAVRDAQAMVQVAAAALRAAILAERVAGRSTASIAEELGVSSARVRQLSA